jgi:hypothetical protein
MSISVLQKATVVGDVAQILGLSLISSLGEESLRKLVTEGVPDLESHGISFGSIPLTHGDGGRRVFMVLHLGGGHGEVELDFKWRV